MSDAKTEAYRDSREVVDPVPMKKIDLAIFVPRSLFAVYELDGRLRYSSNERPPIKDGVVIEYKINEGC